MTPEERREALVVKLREVFRDYGDAEWAAEAVLHHFDENEPAVADAIRYGVDQPYKDQKMCRINYPKGHPKNP